MEVPFHAVDASAYDLDVRHYKVNRVWHFLFAWTLSACSVSLLHGKA